MVFRRPSLQVYFVWHLLNIIRESLFQPPTKYTLQFPTTSMKEVQYIMKLTIFFKPLIMLMAEYF